MNIQRVLGIQGRMFFLLRGLQIFYHNNNNISHCSCLFNSYTVIIFSSSSSSSSVGHLPGCRRSGSARRMSSHPLARAPEPQMTMQSCSHCRGARKTAQHPDLCCGWMRGEEKIPIKSVSMETVSLIQSFIN